MLGNQTPDDILLGICGDTNHFNRTIGGSHPKGCCVIPHNMSTASNYLGPADEWDFGDPFGNSTPSAEPTCSTQVQGVVALARFCVLAKVASSFGMITFVARNCIQTLALPEGKVFTNSQRVFQTVVYVAFMALVAAFCPGLSTALSFAGVLVVVQCLIFPGFMLLAITEKAWEKTVAKFLIVVGSIIGVISLYVTVQGIIDKVEGKH